MKTRTLGRALLRRLRRDCGYTSRGPLKARRTDRAMVVEFWNAYAARVRMQCDAFMRAITPRQSEFAFASASRAVPR